MQQCGLVSRRSGGLVVSVPAFRPPILGIEEGFFRIQSKSRHIGLGDRILAVLAVLPRYF